MKSQMQMRSGQVNIDMWRGSRQAKLPVLLLAGAGSLSEGDRSDGHDECICRGSAQQVPVGDRWLTCRGTTPHQLHQPALYTHQQRSHSAGTHSEMLCCQALVMGAFGRTMAATRVS